MEKHPYRNLIVAFMMALVLASCSKTIVDSEAYADSYIYCFNNKAGVPVYGVIHSVYSFKKLGSVSVTGGAGNVLLDNFNGDGFSFYSKVDSAAFLPSVPAPATYTYNLNYSSGETATRTDATTTSSLLPAQQINAVMNLSSIVLTWKAVAGVEAYKVSVYSEDQSATGKNLVFESDFLVPQDAVSDLSLPFSLVSISSYLTTKLTFQVSSFMFDGNTDKFKAVSSAQFSKYFGN